MTEELKEYIERRIYTIESYRSSARDWEDTHYGGMLSAYREILDHMDELEDDDA